ncbi:hypothetical protein GCM10009736_03800 [Actinomadura bangladeshensis]
MVSAVWHRLRVAVGAAATARAASYSHSLLLVFRRRTTAWAASKPGDIAGSLGI